MVQEAEETAAAAAAAVPAGEAGAVAAAVARSWSAPPPSTLDMGLEGAAGPASVAEDASIGTVAGLHSPEGEAAPSPGHGLALLHSSNSAGPQTSQLPAAEKEEAVEARRDAEQAGPWQRAG